MMELSRTALTLAASLGSGMMAGLFFVFSVAVMDALGRMPPAQGVLAMQSINQEILNPWFFTLFFGTGALGLLLSIIVLLDGRGAEVGYLIAATLLYIGGSIAVTIVRNVPDPLEPHPHSRMCCGIDFIHARCLRNVRHARSRRIAALIPSRLFTFMHPQSRRARAMLGCLVFMGRTDETPRSQNPSASWLAHLLGGPIPAETNSRATP